MEAKEVEATTLTEEGRKIAAEVAYCYVEMSYDGGEYDTKQECRAVAKSRGLEQRDTGVGRDIFDVGADLVTGDRDCVLKMAYNLEGCHECQREAQSWERVPDETRQYLSPVLDHDIGWVLMPQAELGLAPDEIETLLGEFHETGWACEDTNEAHNLGKIDDRPVIIDYGMGCYKLEAGEEPPAEP